jgi:hypothetical protein
MLSLGAHASVRCTRAEGQSAIAGPQELLSGKPVPGSTVLAGHRGPQEQLIGKSRPGSKALAGQQELLIDKPVLRSMAKCKRAKTYFGVPAERRPLMEPCICLAA